MKFSVKSKNDLCTISGNFAFGPIKIWMLLVGQKVDYFLYYGCDGEGKEKKEKEKEEEENVFVIV